MSTADSFSPRDPTTGPCGPQRTSGCAGTDLASPRAGSGACASWPALFDMLALARSSRIGLVLAGVNMNPDSAATLTLIPVIFRVVGAIVIRMLTRRARPVTA
jgi:hypothetical protein